MSTVFLVTGAHGFIGRNLTARLRSMDDVLVHTHHRSGRGADLEAAVSSADVIFHLAGVNRPPSPEEFNSGNAGFTEHLVSLVRRSGRTPLIVFSSSIQAAQDNPYGRSKLAAEQVLQRYARETGARVAVFRLRNVFGKWSRPDYNSVVATFCHNVARDLPITISDAARVVELVYVDDVVDALVRAAGESVDTAEDGVVQDDITVSPISLGELATVIQSFRDIRQTLVVPDLSLRLHKQLYATYLSFVDEREWEYGLDRKADDRGDLAEFIKSPAFGQIFVSRTRPGITRGNHYHNTKAEKFLVLSGTGRIRFRHVADDDVIEVVVRGEDYRVVDIPPGYTHSITNEGSGEMITLFWASEMFDPQRPDTIFLPVDGKGPRT